MGKRQDFIGHAPTIANSVALLGNRFSATTNDDDRSELLVPIAPWVVEGRDDARLVTDDLKRKLRGLKGFTGTTQ